MRLILKIFVFSAYLVCGELQVFVGTWNVGDKFIKSHIDGLKRKVDFPAYNEPAKRPAVARVCDDENKMAEQLRKEALNLLERRSERRSSSSTSVTFASSISKANFTASTASYDEADLFRLRKVDTKRGLNYFDSWIQPGRDLYLISLQESTDTAKFEKAILLYLNKQNQYDYETVHVKKQSGLGESLMPKSTVSLIFKKKGIEVDVVNKHIWYQKRFINNSKGAVICKLKVQKEGETHSIIFVSSHLSPRERNAAETWRRDIVSNIQSEIEKSVIIWAGDFNFRVVDINPSDAAYLLESKETELLKAFDEQSIKEQCAISLVHFNEAEIEFLPTYKLKYVGDAINYILRAHITKRKRLLNRGKRVTAKERLPSWTDRVIFASKKAVSVIDYNAGSPDNIDFHNSDHLPVYALMSI